MTTEIELGLLPRTRETFRQIDYSSLDRDTIERALDDFVRANFPEQRDFIRSTGYKIGQRQIAYVTDLLSYRVDYLANNNLLPTTTNLRAFDNLVSLIGYQRSAGVAAVVDIVIVPQETVGTVDDPSDQRQVRIPATTQITGTGALGLPVVFELFASARDLFSDIIILPGTNNVRAFGVEGLSKSIQVTSNGNRFQEILLPDIDIILDTVRINVGTFDPSSPTIGSLYEPNLPLWERVSFLVLHSTEDVFESRRRTDGLTLVQFGDGNFGNIPPKGQDIIINYRVGGGANGNVLPESLRSTSTFPVFNGGIRSPDGMKVTLTNVNRGAGGRDEETLEEGKFLAPLIFQAQERAVKDIDFTAFALKSPLVSKALAASRQEILIDSFEDSDTYNFPLAETQPFTLKLQVHRLDLRRTNTFTANINVPRTSYTILDEMIIDLNDQLGWEYNEESLAFQEKVAGEGFIARFDKSVEGFLVLIVNTLDYQARVTLLESGNSLIPIVNINFGGYGRVDINAIDVYVLSFSEDGNVVVPNAAIVDELRTLFETLKELQTDVVIRRGFIDRVDVRAHVFVDRSADPQRVRAKVDEAIQDVFGAEKRELGAPLFVSKFYEAIEAVEGVAYVDQFEPAQNIFPNQFTLLQLGDVDITFFEARR